MCCDGASEDLLAARDLVRLLVVETAGETRGPPLPALVATFLLVPAAMHPLVRAKANVSRGLPRKLQPRRPESMCLVT